MMFINMEAEYKEVVLRVQIKTTLTKFRIFLSVYSVMPLFESIPISSLEFFINLFTSFFPLTL